MAFMADINSKIVTECGVVLSPHCASMRGRITNSLSGSIHRCSNVPCTLQHLQLMSTSMMH